MPRPAPEPLDRCVLLVLVCLLALAIFSAPGRSTSLRAWGGEGNGRLGGGGAGAAAAAGAPAGARAADGGSVEVDPERGEVHVPCRFVNPTRQLEVFACHRSGPTHETVVEFDATGAELLEALQAIGCRSPDAWSATSPGDFPRNQGDRLLVLVRWTHRGVEREFPAEAMLLEADTGFAWFVRGFSFSARVPGGSEEAASRPGEEPAEEPFPAEGNAPAELEEGHAQGNEPASEGDGAARIPQAVEITLGASRRERAVFSLLQHPTALRGESAGPGAEPSRALEPWMLPPAVHPEIVPDLRALVAEEAPAVLVFRRLPSEAALISYLRSIATLRDVEDRLPLYDRLESGAQEIDRLKAAYREVASAIEELLATRLDSIPEDCHEDLGARGEMLRRLGQWYSARVQEAYFQMYLEQETFKLEALRKMPVASPEDENPVAGTLDPRVLQFVVTAIEDGLAFEPRLAQKEVEIAHQSLRELVTRQEMKEIELERWSRLNKSRMAEVKARRRELDPASPGDVYLLKLLAEDRLRLENSGRILATRRALGRILIDEVEARLDGSWAQSASCIRARLRRAERELAVGKLDDALLELAESIRWEASESDDGNDGVTRREEEARAKLAELRRREKELHATRDAARRALSESAAAVDLECGDAPPRQRTR